MAHGTLYGLIGKLMVQPGQREALSEILLDGIAGMPGCLSYVVANDSSDDDALWVTEVWESQEAHRDSLNLESVQKAIAKGKPLIAGFGERFETQPLGGTGL
ncbi:putative quinol monooxygenase [Saccharospirillum sp. MSK14-1]|uniref:putative quinol monooxygenase n=1 Tax=Saccharospirillum sp. MSK14-1 TaxID=1897632 RepID=UPI000D361936|nr:putative quinol monooxygenase [Saccharospirillum sp. MSK14-1]